LVAVLVLQTQLVNTAFPSQLVTTRERIRQIIARKTPTRCGFWLGKPHPDTWPILHQHFGTRDEEELRQKLGDDVRWICPQFYKEAYHDPAGRQLFDAGLDREKHGSVGPLADCASVKEVDSFPWPNPDYLNFEPCLRHLRAAGDVYRLSGFWTCYFHNVADLIGMEEYFVKMHTAPEVVQAVTDKVCEFYYEANERFFARANGLVDGFFFGNDLGSQRGLMCSPETIQRFILPWLRRFVDQGHRHGYQVVVHSCGSVHDIIGTFIEAGVDCLHPLQARAHNMNAERLALEFKGRVAFLGGIDAQQVLTRGTPDEVRADVRRVKKLLGPYLIVSPSHEAILPNVPPQNVAALAEAAAEPD
jgi:uroporphyrinogen decarboxylase